MKSNRLSIVIFSACLLFMVSVIQADIKLPAIFGDHMVLQQKSSVNVWGWAKAGEKVSVKGDWMWFAASTKADTDGKWKVKIKTPKAGGPYTLTVKGNNQIVLNDILMGEVWVCSGQSNMEWNMGGLGTDIGKKDVLKANYPKIRYINVEKAISRFPKDDCVGEWRVCSSDNVKSLSAVSYYFAQNLTDNLDVPIGLISTNWGGTLSEAWTSKEGLLPFDRFHDTVEILDSDTDIETEFSRKYVEQVAEWEKDMVKADPGAQQGWYKVDFDDSDWKQAMQPKAWSQSEIGDIDGLVWYRTKIDLKSDWLGKNLHLNLGRIDDASIVWVNGKQLGSVIGWMQMHTYRIPKAMLKEGENLIAVAAYDTGGEGGLLGPASEMKIEPTDANGKESISLASNWKYKLSMNSVPVNPPGKITSVDHNTPTSLYNAMIAPLIQFRIAGAIWYQGESNCYDPVLYRTLFPALVSDWRKQWKQGDFPFYFVQIAPFEYGGSTCSQAVREAQMMTLDKLENVGMAVVMDIGEENDIHPRNKHDVGNRLARWAMNKDYGMDVVYSGPLYKSMETEGNKIRIQFNYTDGGLVARDGDLTDFVISGSDRKFVIAKAVIDGDSIVVSSDKVNKPVSVRYAWSNWAKPNLFNRAGLPASSFRTDDWPIK